MTEAEMEAGIIRQIDSYPSVGALKAWANVRGVGASFDGIGEDAQARIWRAYQNRLELLSQLELWGAG